MKKVLFLAIFVFLLAGCATQQFNIRERGPVRRQPDKEEWQHFYVYALLPTTKKLNTRNICSQSSVAHVETEQTFLNGLTQVVTVGIYTPMTARVWCTGPGGAARRNAPPRRQRQNNGQF